MRLNPGTEKAVAGLYKLFEVGVPQEAKTQDVAKAIGVGTGVLNATRRLLTDNGSLKFDQWKNPREGIVKTTWTLIDPPEVAGQKIDALDYPSISHWRAEHGEASLYARGIIKPFKKNNPVEDDARVYFYPAKEEAKVADVTSPDPEPLLGAPYVWPEPDPKPEARVKRIKTSDLKDLSSLRKSEPRAAVEAARQYTAKWEVAHQHAKALKDAGLIENEGDVLDRLTLEKDEQLDTIARVIPYIDELEHQVSNLEKFQETLRTKAARVESLEIELRRTKEQNSRLIAAKTEVAVNSSQRDA